MMKWTFVLCFYVQVRHRWCELVVKHAYTKAYGDVEHFLVHDQVNTHNCSRFDPYGPTKFLTSDRNLYTRSVSVSVCVCVFVPGHGCLPVRGADGSGGPWATGAGLSLPLIGPRTNGPSDTQSGRGDGSMMLEVKLYSVPPNVVWQIHSGQKENSCLSFGLLACSLTLNMSRNDFSGSEPC